MGRGGGELEGVGGNKQVRWVDGDGDGTAARGARSGEHEAGRTGRNMVSGTARQQE